MTVTRKFIILVVLLAASLCHSQSRTLIYPDCEVGLKDTTASPNVVSSDFDNRDRACTTWTLSYASIGYSAVSVQFEFAPDAGSTPGSYSVWPDLSSGSLPLTITTDGQITGYKYHSWVRIKKVSSTCPASTSCEVRATLKGWRPGVYSDSASNPSSSLSVQSGTWTVQPGNTANTTPWLFSLSQGGNTANVSAAGALSVTTESSKVTYSATADFNPASSGDIVGVCGSASKTVRVTYVSFSLFSTAASGIKVQLIKRSTADTGGTPTTLTAVPNDANDAAATATGIVNFTAAPTPGTTVGVVRSIIATSTTAAGAIPNIQYQWTFGVENDKEIVLRGTAQCVYVNQNSNPAGELVEMVLQWTEE